MGINGIDGDEWYPERGDEWKIPAGIINHGWELPV